MRLEYAAGERMFVDFAGDTVPVTDPETGEIWNAQVFVSVLGASGYLYVEATRSQDLASWLGAHGRPLGFYGGGGSRLGARQTPSGGVPAGRGERPPDTPPPAGAGAPWCA